LRNRRSIRETLASLTRGAGMTILTFRLTRSCARLSPIVSMTRGWRQE
jgi:hypothetical protein